MSTAAAVSWIPNHRQLEQLSLPRIHRPEVDLVEQDLSAKQATVIKLGQIFAKDAVESGDLDSIFATLGSLTRGKFSASNWAALYLSGAALGPDLQEVYGALKAALFDLMSSSPLVDENEDYKRFHEVAWTELTIGDVPVGESRSPNNNPAASELADTKPLSSVPVVPHSHPDITDLTPPLVVTDPELPAEAQKTTVVLNAKKSNPRPNSTNTKSYRLAEKATKPRLNAPLIKSEKDPPTQVQDTVQQPGCPGLPCRSDSPEDPPANTVFAAILRFGHDEDFQPHVGEGTLFSPTDAPAGSPEKIAILLRRVEQGLPLWHPDDRVDYAGLCGVMKPRD